MPYDTFFQDNKDDMLKFFYEETRDFNPELVHCRVNELDANHLIYATVRIADNHPFSDKGLMQEFIQPLLLCFIRELKGRDTIRYAHPEREDIHLTGRQVSFIYTPIPLRIVMARDLTGYTHIGMAMYIDDDVDEEPVEDGAPGQNASEDI